MNIAVIGAGASGIMAAIEAARYDDNHITVFEKNNRVGRKILASGNGRCNLTNLNCDPKKYHGTGADIVGEAFSLFDNEKTIRWFEERGLVFREDRFGRLYPYSDKSNSVLDLLRLNLNKKNISVFLETEVVKIDKKLHGFCLNTNNCKAIDRSYERVIVACGGMVMKQLGGTQRGYELLQDLGHHIVPPGVSLSKVLVQDPVMKQLQGIRTDAHLFLVDRRMNTIAESCGEIQFTKEGISGPAAFDVSRYVGSNSDERNWKGKALIVDLCPVFSEEELYDYFKKKVECYAEDATEQLFTGLLHRILGNCILNKAGIKNNKKLNDLRENDLKRIVFYTKQMQFLVSESSNPLDAQVTTGGVNANEISVNMESRIVDGLYVTGELIDIDGDCGGYNLQWAWTSGYIAGHFAGENK